MTNSSAKGRPMTLKYKAGDTVEITDRLKGHCYKIGEHVVIQRVDDADKDYLGSHAQDIEGDYNSWFFTDKECKLVKAKEE